MSYMIDQRTALVMNGKRTTAASKWKVTIADTGLPGSAKNSVGGGAAAPSSAPAVAERFGTTANVAGLPGFIMRRPNATLPLFSRNGLMKSWSPCAGKCGQQGACGGAWDDTTTHHADAA